MLTRKTRCVGKVKPVTLFYWMKGLYEMLVAMHFVFKKLVNTATLVRAPLCVCHGGLNDTSALVDFEKRWFRPSKVTYMCVPISLTSWWMTSSIQLSGLSSEKAEFEADKFNLWELVCRSACERRESWDSSETKQLQKILYYFTRAVTFTRISLTTWLLSLCTLM